MNKFTLTIIFLLSFFNLNAQVDIRTSTRSSKNSEYYNTNLSMVGFSDGLYVVKLKTENEVLTGKFVKR